MVELLSEFVALLMPRFSESPGLDVGGEWAIQFPAQPTVKFETIVQGHCWIRVEGAEQPYHLQRGDCFLLNTGHPFLIGSSLRRDALHASDIFPKGCDGLIQIQGGGSCHAVGGRFTFEGDVAASLLASLPPIIVLPATVEEAANVSWALQAFSRELEAQRRGSVSNVEQLAQIMLLQIVRFHLGTAQESDQGFLALIGDPKLSRAITALHADLARSWTVETLAYEAAMSRSAFASRFRKSTALTPLEYLTLARMRRAAQLLLTTQDTCLHIAGIVGYASEAAFSTAFRRRLGQSPRGYRRQHKRSEGDLQTHSRAAVSLTAL